MKVVDKASISIIVPIYNEAENIPHLLEKIYTNLLDYNYELILVDDGSKDNSKEIAMRLKNASTKIVLLDKNYGQSTALKAGIDASVGEIIAFLDGDLQNDPIDLPSMIKILQQGETQLVQGFRKSRHDSLSKLIPSFVANRLIRYVFNTTLNDIGCTLKVFKRSAIVDMYYFNGFHRYFPLIVYLNGHKVIEQVVSHYSRKYGKSNYSIGRVFSVVHDLYLLKNNIKSLDSKLEYSLLIDS